jgi:hypothetical protein
MRDQGTVLPVSDEASFKMALRTATAGDTLYLADGTYPLLTVREKQGLTIAGSREARVDGIQILDSTQITVRGLTLTPSAERRAEITVKRNSSQIVVDGVLIDGRDERAGAGVVADQSVSGLVVRSSEITNCGRGQRCIAASGTVGVEIFGNAFRDCLSCDFIRGGSGMTIRKNTFDRSVHGACLDEGGNCAHNDHIQILGGGPWVIASNRFGEREGGAASIFVSPGRENDDNPIHDVRIASNLFLGTTGNYAIRIVGGAAPVEGRIRGISIINNTILQGKIAALDIAAGWESLPTPEWPLVANNIFGRMKNSRICERATVVASVVVNGSANCPSMRAASVGLDATGAPTSASSAIIDQADPAYAPTRDYLGKKRVGRPDIGAIEYRPLKAKPRSG